MNGNLLYSVQPVFLSYLGQVIMNKLKTKPLRNKDIFIQIYPFIFLYIVECHFFLRSMMASWLLSKAEWKRRELAPSTARLPSSLNSCSKWRHWNTLLSSCFFLCLRCFLFFLFTQSQNAFFYYQLSTGFELLVLPEKQTYLFYLTSISFYLQISYQNEQIFNWNKTLKDKTFVLLILLNPFQELKHLLHNSEFFLHYIWETLE